MSYFDFHGLNIFYQVIESNSASNTVALIHGNAASSKMFSPILKQYTKRYSVLLIDFLGYGKSDKPGTLPDNLWHYESEQLIAVVESLFSQKIDLVGTSGGALVSLNAVLARPDLFRSAIADSFMGFHTTNSFTEYLQEERAEARKSVFNRLFFKYQHGKDWPSAIETDTAAILQHAKQSGDYIEGDITKIKVPVLFTASREDPFIQTGTVIKDIADLAQGNPMMSYRFFEKGGHPAMISNADIFIKLVEDFFRDPLNSNNEKEGP